MALPMTLASDSEREVVGTWQWEVCVLQRRRPTTLIGVV